MNSLHCPTCRLQFETTRVSAVGAPCPRCNSWAELASHCAGSCLSCGPGQATGEGFSCNESGQKDNNGISSFGNGLLIAARLFFNRLFHRV